MSLFWALAIGAVVVLLLGLDEAAPELGSVTRDATALEILRQRYASGELDTAQFEQKRRDSGA